MKASSGAHAAVWRWPGPKGTGPCPPLGWRRELAAQSLADVMAGTPASAVERTAAGLLRRGRTPDGYRWH
ncbi:hypothetical protein Stube_45680 [Streptomyces tubercidicus]|uniref:Uncharacterized protein n=1 Tax=Streptomyces tubercidicus TaxID=47759 RepID=A0A640UZ84_9ACTN|nr:hypothetical protein Stube_45680 [Streptomyces tubercidicus]